MGKIPDKIPDRTPSSKHTWKNANSLLWLEDLWRRGGMVTGRVARDEREEEAEPDPERPLKLIRKQLSPGCCGSVD